MKITLNNHTIDLTNVNWDEIETLQPDAHWWQSIVAFLKDWADPNLTINLITSGSTGTPKTIVVEKKYLHISAEKTCKFFNLGSQSTGLLCLSADYIAGKMMLVRAIVSGMKLICVEPSGNPVKNLSNEIDFAALVPYQLQQSLETPLKLKLIKNLVIGGGTIQAPDAEMLAALEITAFETFGMTETLSHFALKQISPKRQKLFSTLNGITVSKDAENRLIIYYPELRIEKLQTNDVVEIINDKTFKWIGRLDFTINSGGIKISPEVLEEKIATFIIPRFCIVGFPDEKLGEKVVLLIEGKSFNTMKIYGQMKQLLPPHHCPKEIRFLERFPLTESGKIKRKELVVK